MPTGGNNNEYDPIRFGWSLTNETSDSQIRVDNLRNAMETMASAVTATPEVGADTASWNMHRGDRRFNFTIYEDSECDDVPIAYDTWQRIAYILSYEQYELIENDGLIPFDLESWQRLASTEATTYMRDMQVMVNEGEESNEHFESRQSGRSDQDARFFDRRMEDDRNNAGNIVSAENQTLPVNKQNDSLCIDCMCGIKTRSPNKTSVETPTGLVCKNCAANYRNCIKCETLHPWDLMLSDEVGDMLCVNCASELNKCNGCGRYTKKLGKYKDVAMCENCIGNNATYEGSREAGTIWRAYPYTKLLKLNSDDEGNIVKSHRVFSTEIECQSPTSRIFEQVAVSLPAELGVASDASISGHGVEFQTPKLSGKKGEEFIVQICQKLNKNKFATDKTCGLHIHLDGGMDFSPANANGTVVRNIKLLWAFHWVFEDVITSFLPGSRRANKYCKSLKEHYALNSIMNIHTRRDLEALWYSARNNRTTLSLKGEHHNPTRYMGLNLHSLFSKNHVEIRYHSGTLSALKILEWINLHTRIVDFVCSGKIIPDALKDAQMLMKPDEKAEYMFKLLKLPKTSIEYFTKRSEKFASKEGGLKEESALEITE